MSAGERVALHRRDCRKDGGYGETRADFSPWIECPNPDAPHDPQVEHRVLVDARLLEEADERIADLETWNAEKREKIKDLEHDLARERERCAREAYDWIENYLGTAEADAYLKSRKP